MGLLEDLRSFLIAQNIVEGSTGWKCYLSFNPDDTDQTVTITSTGGFPNDTLNRENLRRTVQIAVRAGTRDYATAEAKWYQIFNALDTGDLTAYGIHLIDALANGPLDAGYDAKQRPNLTSNWTVHMERA